MPIKFRCQHCDQFLGIAKSRAGARVDCPRCGKALRVPGTSPVASQQLASRRSEDSLVSALSELSALADDHIADDNSALLPDHTTVASVDSIQETVPQVAVAPPMKVERLVPSTTDVTELTVEEFDREPATEPLGDDEGLAELAALSADYPSGGDISPALLDEMRSVSRGTGQAVATLFGGICLLLLGIAGGWYLARSGSDPGLPLLNLTSARQRFGVPREESTTPQSPSAPETERIITGSVQYESESGKRLPDDGAVVLILPVKHPGTLLLNAQSLIRSDDHADFKATAAALASLGGRIVRAANDGSFATSIPPDSNFIAIAVSQHVSRPDAIPLPTGINNVLKTWFDSPSRLAGRRAATASPLDGETSDIPLVICR